MLKNLKHLKLIYCKNISFNFCNLSEVKFFQLEQNRYCLLNEEDNPLLKFPNLNTLIYTNYADIILMIFYYWKKLQD